MFDGKFLTLLVFIIINFSILLRVKQRISVLIAIIIAHLFAIIFFSISTVNYIALKEMVLALVVYSMVILFLVASYDFEGVAADKVVKNKWTILFFGAGISLLLALFFAMFFLSESLPKIAKKIHEQKVVTRDENVATAASSASGAITVAEINQKKRARLKDKLSDSFLFKRSSDVILIIVAASTTLLLATNRTAKNKS